MMPTSHTIVAFGDSITLAARQEEGKKWVQLLEADLNAAHPNSSCTVINTGVGGNTSREGLARIEEDVLSRKPDIVLVEFGGNDATPDKERHVPLDEYEENLAAIASRLSREVSAQMILLTFPPVINEWHAHVGDQHYEPYGGQDQMIEEYRQATRSFASAQGLKLADIDSALRAAIASSQPEDYILPDGVHLTSAGNRVVADAVFPVLESSL